jgi:hypothetical protein
MRHAAPRLTSLLVVMSLMVAACGQPEPSPSTAPSPESMVAPTLAPTPSPTAVDVADAFIRIIASPGFSATAVVDGTLALGSAAGDLSGNAIFAGSSSDTTVRFDVPDFSQETQSISIGSKNWSRTSPGPWLAGPDTAASSGSVSGTLAAIASVEDLGVVSKAGRSLHHLQPEGGGTVSPAVVGFDADLATDAAFVLDVFAADDGTPAIIGISGSWTQTAQGQAVPVHLDLEFTLSDVGVPQAIDPPEDVWILNTSKAFPYRMAYPPGWTVEPSKTEDAYAVDGQPYIYVAPQTVDGGTTLDDFSSSLQTFYKDDFGEPTSEVATTLGRQPGERLIFEFVNDQAQDVTLVDDITVRGRTGWEVFLVTAGGASDIPIFDRFVATFEFTD